LPLHQSPRPPQCRRGPAAFCPRWMGTCVRMSRPLREFRAAIDLMDIGRSDREIEELTGAPRNTVRNWRNGVGVAWHRRHARATYSWRPPCPATYAYLLGVYLGDGHIIIPSERSARLVVTLDRAYPGVVTEVSEAIRGTFPATAVRLSYRSGGSCAALAAADPALPFAFPQHGPGRKHLRPIRLTSWQRAIGRVHPELLLRGLIHSASRSTSIRATSSRTCQRTSVASSASTATWSAYAGRRRTRATSPYPTGRASRVWTSSSARSGEADSATESSATCAGPALLPRAPKLDPRPWLGTSP
jgi:hypothetical protein